MWHEFDQAALKQLRGPMSQVVPLVPLACSNPYQAWGNESPSLLLQPGAMDLVQAPAKDPGLAAARRPHQAALAQRSRGHRSAWRRPLDVGAAGSLENLVPPSSSATNVGDWGGQSH